MDITFLGDAIFFLFLAVPFVFLLWMLKEAWNHLKSYYLLKWYLGVTYIVLEIKLPKEQYKTPAAMEAVLTALWEPGDGNGWKEDWLGLNTLSILSFEIASIGGSIHFFFWVPEKFKPRVEAHVYAQYPQAEITHVPDYTRLITFDWEKDKIMGFDYKQTAKEAIVPIRTYKAMGLDQAGEKEEQKVDPITQTLEVMASIGPHENMWLQLVTRPLKNQFSKAIPLSQRWKKAWENKNPFLLFRQDQGNWKIELEEIVKKIKDDYTPKNREELLPFAGAIDPRDKEFAAVVLQNAQKTAYEVGMRTIYFAPKEHWNGAQPSNMGSLFKAYGSNEPYNNFQPAFVAVANDKWWEPGHEKSVDELKKLMFPDYQQRRFFVGAHGEVGHGFYAKQYPTMMLSVEELATIYHFPGSVAQTPTFERLPSATLEAPANLPTGGTPANLPH